MKKMKQPRNARNLREDERSDNAVGEKIINVNFARKEKEMEKKTKGSAVRKSIIKRNCNNRGKNI